MLLNTVLSVVVTVINYYDSLNRAKHLGINNSIQRHIKICVSCPFDFQDSVYNSLMTAIHFLVN